MGARDSFLPTTASQLFDQDLEWNCWSLERVVACDFWADTLGVYHLLLLCYYLVLLLLLLFYY